MISIKQGRYEWADTAAGEGGAVAKIQPQVICAWTCDGCNATCESETRQPGGLGMGLASTWQRCPPNHVQRPIGTALRHPARYDRCRVVWFPFAAQRSCRSQTIQLSGAAQFTLTGSNFGYSAPILFILTSRVDLPLAVHVRLAREPQCAHLAYALLLPSLQAHPVSEFPWHP